MTRVDLIGIEHVGYAPMAMMKAPARPTNTLVRQPLPSPEGLRALLREHNLQQWWVAEALGMTRNGVRDWLRGKNRIRPAVWALLQLILGIHPAATLEWKRRPPPGRQRQFVTPQDRILAMWDAQLLYEAGDEQRSWLMLFLAYFPEAQRRRAS